MDYNRYIYPYYAGWLVAALALLAVGLHQREKVSVARLGALVLCALCLYRFQQFVPSQLSVIDYPDSFYQGERRTAAQVEQYTRYLPKEARVFFISQHDNGLHWFRYFYYFYPYQMDYSFGGGTLSKDMIIGDGALEASFQGEQRKAFSGQPLTAQRLVEYIEHQKIDYLFIHEADETLLRDYGHLFADGLEQWSTRRTTLYRVERQNGQTIFVPVAMEGGAPQ